MPSRRVDPVGPHPHRAVLGRQVAAGVDEPGVDDEVGAGLAQQLDEAGDGPVDAVRVAPALEAGRRLGAQPEPRGGRRRRRSDRTRPSPAHVGRGVVDLRRRAAHHPGDADRAVVGVADQQVVGRERALDAVEGHQRLAVGGPADAEAAAAQLSRS